jgi:hypothetical protein
MRTPIDLSDTVGPVFGGAAVLSKKLYAAFIIGTIDAYVIVDTVLLSAIGALVGFIVTELAKYFKRKLFDKDGNKKGVPKSQNPPPPPPKKSATISVLVLAILFSGCVTYNKCLDKFGELEPVTITLRDTLHHYDTILTSAKSLQGSIPVSELLEGYSLQHSTPEKLSLYLSYDHDTVKYDVYVEPDTIIRYKEIPVEVSGDCPPVVVVNPAKGMSLPQKLWRKWEQASAWLMLVMVLAFFLLFRNLTLYRK